MDKRSPFLKRQGTVEDAREVYIVMFVRFFSSVGDHYSEKENRPFAKLLGVLEKIEVYDDLALSELLYSENYSRLKRKRPVSKEASSKKSTKQSDAKPAVNP